MDDLEPTIGTGATGPIADLTDDRFLLGKDFSIPVMSSLNTRDLSDQMNFKKS